MLAPIHNPAAGKLRVIGFASGSGDTLWKVLETQKEMEASASAGGCPFEVVGVFCSKKDAKALAAAEKYGVPAAFIDIKEFYTSRGAPLSDKTARAQFDAAAQELIRPWKGNLILLAGYVWATTDCLLDEYTIINVHPADLSVMKDGRRAYAGGNGVGAALDAKEPALCSSAHLATKQVDGGPLLIISERIPVDYGLHAGGTERMRHYLKLVNEQSRMVGGRTILEVALGSFTTDEEGQVFYQGKASPHGLRIEHWSENIPLYKRDMEKLFYPESVAVVGASQKPGIGNSLISNIMSDGFSGAVYAVNVRGEDVGKAKGYVSVDAIEGPVDLAVIATPGAAVLGIAEDCGKKGVKAIICITAGFKEMGGEGILAQERLMAIVNKYNMRLIGPNCMGEMNVKIKLNATILFSHIARGSVALVTQSGAIGAAMLDSAEALGLGFSSIVSLGNQADVNLCDLLPFYEKDEHTRVIALYLESILDPVRFWQTAARIRKPIVLLKSGRTVAGMAAASSHTGSLAGNDAIVNALVKKAGVIRVYSLEELFTVSSSLSAMPQVKGNRVCLLTNAGGPGILISDKLNDLGFELPPPSDTLKAHLRENLLKEASVNNPIDVVAPAPPEHYALTAKAVLESGEYDALILCCVPPATVDTGKVAEALLPVVRNTTLPVLSCFCGTTIGRAGRDVLRENHIPTGSFPEQTALILAAMRERRAGAGDTVAYPDAQVSLARKLMAPVPSGEYLPVLDAREMLRLFGVPVPQSGLLKAPEDAMAFKGSYPVVAKIEHPQIVHKSDVGGVRLNIGSAAELAGVVREFLGKFSGANGVFVQEMVPQGLEIIVGGVFDAQLGSSVMVGLGGVWVEVMKDVAFGYPPFTRAESLGLINSLRSVKLLDGYRGSPPADKEALAEIIERVGAMLLALPGLTEVDINPLIFDAGRKTFVAADARIKKG
jgi:acetyltransferase